VRALGAERRKRPLPHPRARRPFAGPATRRLSGAIRKVGKWRVPDDAEPSPYNLRGFAPVTPRVLLVGASTGGPQALMKLVGKLDAVTASAPVLITQHMPATFTTILAEQLAHASGRPAHEAVDGEPVLAGTIYLAPGGRHMRVVRRNGTAAIALDDGPPVHYCRPAVDPLFSSAAEVWGPWNLGVILTGMGHDGTAGAADIVAQGGSVIAQDEASSVIWGMPGSAVEAGVCSAVMPLDQIGPRVVRLFLGARP
jgi:two-component system, chemotaxis family, protein-glutamate methylesterase/glutaminase